MTGGSFSASDGPLDRGAAVDHPRAGVVGWPIAHSRSPLIHRYWLAQHQLGGQYEHVPISPEQNFEACIRGLMADGWRGVNVTIPYKEKAFAIADTARETAKALSAANMLSFQNGQIVADNSDGYGFLAHLDDTAPRPQWVDRPACIIGAGGAARAIIVALMAAGVREIYLVNRTPARAQSLVQSLGKSDGVTVLALDDAAGIAKCFSACGLVVNTTSLGMSGQPELALDLAPLSDLAVVYDIVYAPLETPLLAQARSRGLLAVDGLGMLLHQAVPAFEAWFGCRPKVTPALRAHIEADLVAKTELAPDDGPSRAEEAEEAEE